jgi:hypothetical protein
MFKRRVEFEFFRRDDPITGLVVPGGYFHRHIECSSGDRHLGLSQNTALPPTGHPPQHRLETWPDRETRSHPGSPSDRWVRLLARQTTELPHFIFTSETQPLDTRPAAR